MTKKPRNYGSPNNIENFDSRGNDLLLWVMRSDELYLAAAVVWHGSAVRLNRPAGAPAHPLLYRPAQLLMGLCLESLAKGLIVHRSPGLISGGQLPKKLKTHSLERLFGELAIRIDDDDQMLRFVRVLADAVEWIAKYPVPTAADQLEQGKHNGKDLFARNDLDFERFETLRERVLQAIGQPAEFGVYSSPRSAPSSVR